MNNVGLLIKDLSEILGARGLENLKRLACRESARKDIENVISAMPERIRFLLARKNAPKLLIRENEKEFLPEKVVSLTQLSKEKSSGFKSPFFEINIYYGNRDNIEKVEMFLIDTYSESDNIVISLSNVERQTSFGSFVMSNRNGISQTTKVLDEKDANGDFKLRFFKGYLSDLLEGDLTFKNSDSDEAFDRLVKTEYAFSK